MKHLEFVSCPSAPDVWMRSSKHSDWMEYYEYILLYTNNALAIGENKEQILQRDLGQYFELKEESIGSPKIYLGEGVRKVDL